MGQTTIKLGTPEWHEARRTRITATDWAALLLDRERPRWLKSPMEVWARLTGRTQPEEAVGAHLEWGTRMEAAAAPWYAELTGREVHREHVLWTMGDALACTPDGWWHGKDGCSGGLWECKAPGPWGKQDWEQPDGSRKVPLVYQIQVQAQQFVTGASTAAVCALSWPELLYGDVPRNDRFLERAYERLMRFWDYNVQGDRPPEPTGEEGDAKILAAMHTPEVAVVTMPTDVVDLCDGIELLQAEASALDYKLKEKKNALRAWMQEQKAERAVHPGGDYAWSFGPRGLRRVKA